MGRPACSGYDDAQSAGMGGLAVVDHLAGHPVGGDDVGLEAHSELLEGLGSGSHDGPV